MLGVVAYLNMLPFFGESDETELYRSPVLLNQALHEGEVAAGCVSAIAGVSAGLPLVGAGFGVATCGPVRSVYLEPLFLGPDCMGFWESVSLEWTEAVSRWCRTGLLPHTRTRVLVLTTGESAQSLWLFRVLLRLVGLDVGVVDVGREAASASPAALRERFLRNRTSESHGCLLSIGDGALMRTTLHPHAVRLDLGDVWQRASGLPCVFASWFASKTDSPEVSALVEKILARWERANGNERIARVDAWKGTPLSASEGLAYLERIQHRFSDEHRETLGLYQRLLACPGLACVP